MKETTPTLKPLAWLACLALASPDLCRAAEADEPPAVLEAAGEVAGETVEVVSDARKRFFDALFNTQLPFTNPDSAWELNFRPKFHDLVDEPYIRLPLELTYGFTDNIEGMIGYTPYLSNPFDSDGVSSGGYVNLGIKQRLDSFIHENWQLGLGATARMPIDEIPAEPNDIRANYARYEPYIVFTRQSVKRPRWQQVLSISYMFVNEDPFDAVSTAGPLPHSLVILRPGIIYKPPGEWRYSLEFDYKTERFDGGDNYAFSIIPGVVWYPNQSGRGLPLPGNFDIGFSLGYVLKHLPEDRGRSDLRAAVNVRWRLDSASKRKLKNYLRGTQSDDTEDQPR